MYYQDEKDVSEIVFYFCFLQNEYYNNLNQEYNLSGNDYNPLYQGRTEVGLPPLFYNNITNAMTYLSKEDNSNEEDLDNFDNIHRSNNFNNFAEANQIGENFAFPEVSTNKHTTEFTDKEDSLKNDNKYTIKISNETKGKKKKKNLNAKNKVAKSALSNSKHKINNIVNPSTKPLNETQQKEFELLTKIKRKRTLTKNNKKKNILGSLCLLKIERKGKIHSDKQRYTKNPLFHMDFKKVKKYLTIEDNVLDKIKNLSSNESKVEKDPGIKTKQVEKNIRIMNIVNSLKAVKLLKEPTQK